MNTGRTKAGAAGAPAAPGPAQPAGERTGGATAETGQPGHQAPEGSGVREISARAVAERVLTCPDVDRLSGGPFGAVATYLPGGQVPGVVVREDQIEVHVVARYGRPLPDVADAVRDAIGDLAGGRRIDVTIADVTSAGDTREEK